MSKRSEDINKMFSDIAGNYDRMNHIMSWGVDWAWREDAAAKLWTLIDRNNPRIIDIATGTGDLAFAVERRGGKRGKPRIVGMDFNRKMLEIGRAKAAKESEGNVEFVYGDALHLPYEEGSFDAVTSGFAVRSMDDLDLFAGEIYRVLRPGGAFVLLDMAMPDGTAQRTFFSFYSLFMRGVGAFVSNKAYGWLVGTIKKFDKRRFVKILQDTGFEEVGIKQLATGVAYIVYGYKR